MYLSTYLSFHLQTYLMPLNCLNKDATMIQKLTVGTDYALMPPRVDNNRKLESGARPEIELQYMRML